MRATHHINMLIVCLYLDVLIITGNDKAKIEVFKGKMKSEFKMTDLGSLNYFLRPEFMHTRKGVLLHRKKYACEILKGLKWMIIFKFWIGFDK